MKHTHILAVMVLTLALICSGCGGTSDYVQSVQITSPGTSTGGFYNLAGQDGTLQLVTNAVYHSGKTVPVTTSVTYSVTPIGYQSSGDQTDPDGQALPAYGPQTVPIDATGLMTAVGSMCTWIDVGIPLPTPPQYNWLYTGYYSVTATYNGMTSQPVAIGVGSLSGNAPDGSCGPK